VTAFAFQAVGSWALSAILEVILPDLLGHGPLRPTRPVRRSLFRLASFRDEIERIEQDLHILTHWVDEKEQHFRRLFTDLTTLREGAQKYIQEFAKINSPLELHETHVLENIHERSPRQKARSVVAEILYFSSDVQTLAGQYSIYERSSVLC
jgi:hypothetical protein